MKLVKEINYQDARMKMLTNNRDDYFVDVDTETFSTLLGYQEKNGVEKVISRNPYLKTREFSRIEKVVNIENGTEKIRDIRIFTEDGIMEVAFLASTEKAREFRAFIRHLFKKLRASQNSLNNENIMTMQENYKLMEKSYKNLRGATEEVLKVLKELNNQKSDDVIKLLDTIEKELIRAGKKIDKIDTIEKRLDRLENRMDTIEKKFDTLGQLFGRK